jgi:MFS family permease
MVVLRVLGSAVGSSKCRRCFSPPFLQLESRILLTFSVIFTVANLIITDVFSPTTQALAGAVFNTVAQFGNSLGIMTMAIISSTVTMHSGYAAKKSPQALMQGYRAVFWTCFGLMLSACCVGLLGLRKVGKVGLKRE